MTILQTERLLLRPLAPTDFAAFRTFAADGELTKYMLFYPLEQEAELHTFLQNAAQAWNSLFPQTYEFAVLRKAELLGTVTLEYMTPEQGMLGWLFRADAHGKGYATEAAAVQFFMHGGGFLSECDSRFRFCFNCSMQDMRCQFRHANRSCSLPQEH